MTATSQNSNKLIHAAKIFTKNGVWRYLLLRRLEVNRFTWFLETKQDEEEETEISGINIEEAIQKGWKAWKMELFKPVNCGFKYYLPDRDEHGINALFHQMASSYASMNGVYYDEELGNNCFVQSASKEALALWQRLKKHNRL